MIPEKLIQKAIKKSEYADLIFNKIHYDSFREGVSFAEEQLKQQIKCKDLLIDKMDKKINKLEKDFKISEKRNDRLYKFMKLH